MARYDGKANLIQNKSKSPEETRAETSKAGIKSGQVRREKRAMKEMLLEMLNLPLKTGDIQEIQTLAEIKGKNITVGEAIMFAQIQKAMRGDTQAAIYIRDTTGQKPKEDKVEVHDIVIKVAIEQEPEYDVGDPYDYRPENQ